MTTIKQPMATKMKSQLSRLDKSEREGVKKSINNWKNALKGGANKKKLKHQQSLILSSQ